MKNNNLNNMMHDMRYCTFYGLEHLSEVLSWDDVNILDTKENVAFSIGSRQPLLAVLTDSSHVLLFEDHSNGRSEERMFLKYILNTSMNNCTLHEASSGNLQRFLEEFLKNVRQRD